ncbi:MAG TPA: hypothetical protein VNN18_05605 [Candidatus Xenobia bacterium]|nr:hypothetical protein [Candidatus Xenobia bacterium]
MAQIELLEQVHRLKAELEEVEARLRRNDIPIPVLEDFKSAIDHIRLTLWGILQASGSGRYEAAATIIRFRMRRVEDICRQIVSSIDAQEITVESPELKKLHETLNATVSRINQLYRSGL